MRIWKIRNKILIYLEEQGASSYYDDEREVCVDTDEHTESFDDYVVDDEGWYLWKE